MTVVFAPRSHHYRDTILKIYGAFGEHEFSWRQVEHLTRFNAKRLLSKQVINATGRIGSRHIGIGAHGSRLYTLSSLSLDIARKSSSSSTN